MSRISMKDSFARAPAPASKDHKPRRIANNTFRWIDRNGYEAIRLHTTDIIRRLPDGLGGIARYRLDSGGWKSPTTKARLNDHLPGYVVFSERGQWRICRHGDWDNAIPFADGMIVPDAFEAGSKEAKRAERQGEAGARLGRAIKAFVDRLDTMAQLPQPNAGDCLICMVERESHKPGEYMGDPCTGDPHAGNDDHIRTHVDEGYLHGNLIVNAMSWAGWTDYRMTLAFGEGVMADSQRQAIKHILRRYLRRRLGLAA